MDGAPTFASVRAVSAALNTRNRIEAKTVRLARGQMKSVKSGSYLGFAPFGGLVACSFSGANAAAFAVALYSINSQNHVHPGHECNEIAVDGPRFRRNSSVDPAGKEA